MLVEKPLNFESIALLIKTSIVLFSFKIILIALTIDFSEVTSIFTKKIFLFNKSENLVLNLL